MKKICVLLLALLLTIALGVNALAGNGDGSGGGKDQPLALASSTVPDGSTDVPTELSVTLTFNKNVVNFTVKDNNMGCFRLLDSAGNAAPITVLMGDDQVDPDCKRIVGIQASGLAAGETYTLIISGSLQAKSGATLGSDVSIRFTTAGAAPAETPAPAPVETSKPTEAPRPVDTPKPTETPKPIETPKPTETPRPTEMPKPAETPKPSETPAPTASPEQTEPSSGTAWIVILGGVTAVALAAALVIRTRKNKY